MPPETLKYLEDVKFCIERIEYHIKDITSFRDFVSSWTVYDAVERRLAIIGEAVWQLDKIDKDIFLTNKKRIIGFRHVLTHDYDLISPEIVWKILENDLPILKIEISTLLNK